jgi:hypothetical protein
MRTDELIARLAENPAPVGRNATARTLARGLFAGAFAALTLTVMVLGMRRDMHTAVFDWQYWAKFSYPLAFAALGFFTVERLSRPGIRATSQAVLEAAPFALAVALALTQWWTAPVEQHYHMLFGHSYLLCPWLIVLVSLPVLVGVLWSMRQLAPTRPAIAGLAAGLFAGATGAWIYAFSCNESSLVFVAIWYTLGIVLTGFLGALIGPRVLRW